MKSEPGEFSINDLESMPNQTEHWDGVRNYQARNFMRDDMKTGGQVFFYHSNCDDIGIVGITEVVREGYPDFTAWDKSDSHYDPKTDPDNPRWIMVDIKFVRKFKRTISLKALKENPVLKDMRLIQRGNRLSVMPVEENEWQAILDMES